MSLDTKYRPRRYTEILGQQATIKICRQFVAKGQGFRQSYVFAGPWGSGKTTTARILARALLCENPKEGDPCDECHQCRTLLDDRNENYVEVDAATNSGKEDIKRLTDEVQYGSFSGRRKVYLLDESHQLSKQSMDAMLKPLEDNIRGTEDKQMVAIFCTTEPEKMRMAILSRAAPMFRIHTNTVQEIAGRLDYICEQESIERELPALKLIAEVTECHFRDAIKAIEGVSMLGAVDLTNVRVYLSLDVNEVYLELLEMLGRDLPGALEAVERICTKVSPSTCYERLAEISVLAYRLARVGTTQVPSYWDRHRLMNAGDLHQEFLIPFAERFSQRPAHATAAMLSCDVAALHQLRAGVVVRAAPAITEIAVPTANQSSPPPARQIESAPLAEVAQQNSVESPPKPESTVKVSEKESSDTGIVSPAPFVTETGVFMDPHAQNSRRVQEPGSKIPTADTAAVDSSSLSMSPSLFRKILHQGVIELMQGTNGRSPRRPDMGGS